MWGVAEQQVGMAGNCKNCIKIYILNALQLPICQKRLLHSLWRLGTINIDLYMQEHKYLLHILI